jgi:hypothetical protein
MKSLMVLVVAFAMAGGVLNAQQDSSSRPDETQTLIPSGDLHSGGFGALVVKLGNIDNQLGVIAGGRGGWVINKTFVLGGGGYGYTNASYYNGSSNAPDTNFAFGYGGLELEYLYEANRVVHGTFLLHIGGGGFTVFRMYEDSFDHHNTDNLYTAACFVLEPAVTVEVNILTWLRLQLGAGYRMVTGLSDYTIGDRTYGNSSVSGFFGLGSIKFGPY